MCSEWAKCEEEEACVTGLYDMRAIIKKTKLLDGKFAYVAWLHQEEVINWRFIPETKDSKIIFVIIWRLTLTVSPCISGERTSSCETLSSCFSWLPPSPSSHTESDIWVSGMVQEVCLLQEAHSACPANYRKSAAESESAFVFST